MNVHSESNLDERSKPGSILFLFPSGILGGGALWYAWLRFTSLISRIDADWYDWINPVMVLLLGFVCLWASLLFIIKNSSAMSIFKLGLSIVPVVLFVNLIILVIRVAIGILQGNAGFFLERILSYPHKALLIPIIVIALLILGVLTKTEEKKAK